MPRKTTIRPADLAPYAENMCTQQEVAAIFGVTQQAISQLLKKPEYRKVWEGARNATRYRLRKVQIENALAGKTVDGIWLGKQYLEQRDSPRELEVSQNVKVEFVATWGGGALPAADGVETIEGEVEEE